MYNILSYWQIVILVHGASSFYFGQEMRVCKYEPLALGHKNLFVQFFFRSLRYSAYVEFTKPLTSMTLNFFFGGTDVKQMLGAKTMLCRGRSNGSNNAPTKEPTLSRNLVARNQQIETRVSCPDNLRHIDFCDLM